MQLIDIGLNLAHPQFQRDRAAVVARAQAAGVVQAVLTGATVDDSAQSLALADGRWSWATAGVHPHHADQVDGDALRRLAELAQDPRCVAIGECGLDFARDYVPRSVQERAFDAQLQLAADLEMPVFLHQRDAWDRFAGILSNHRHRLSGAVVHCFTDGPDVARAALELGCQIGLTGWVCDDRRAAAVRASVPVIPLDRLMLETDAPFLSPRDLPRSKQASSPVHGVSLGRLRGRNEPALLPWICRAVATYGGHEPVDLARATTANTRRFFGLPDLPEIRTVPCPTPC